MGDSKNRAPCAAAADSRDNERLPGVSGAIVGPLLAWYEKNARQMPWREDTDPYHVWISEIMLQQTRIDAVIPYYRRFIGQLPDIAHLAGCEDDRLLKLWEGLGYYSRARNLKKAAQILCEENGGQMYPDYRRIVKLPGIGPYTAGAIASIAFGEVVCAVDGNVLRVAARLDMDEGNILEKPCADRIRARVASVIPKEAPGSFNQALMELGETLCLPGERSGCGRCPLFDLCLTGKTGMTGSIPVRQKKTERRKEQKTVFVISDQESVFIRRRPETGLLAGMYEFPWAEGHIGISECRDYVSAMGFQIREIIPLQKAKHIFTHIEWQMKGYLIMADLSPSRADPALLRTGPGQLETKYPIPAAYRKYVKELQKVMRNGT